MKRVLGLGLVCGLMTLLSSSLSFAQQKEYASWTEWNHANRHLFDGSTTSNIGLQESLNAPQSFAHQANGTVVVVPTYFTDATAFDAMFPGLPVEDFEDSLSMPGGTPGCDEPANENSDDDCFEPGDIIPQLSLRTFEGIRSGCPVECPMVALGDGVLGVPTTVIAGPNFFTDTLLLETTAEVCALGMDLVIPSPELLNITITTQSGVVNTTAMANNTGLFWGLATDEDPIVSIHFVSPSGGGELLDNIRLGLNTCVTEADLSITKDDGLSTVVAGTSNTYTIVAGNAGPNDVVGASVVDTFLADLSCQWTCIAAGGASCAAGPVSGDINDSVDLPNGGSATYTVNCDVDSASTGMLSNTATITVPVDVTDPDPTNNSATDTTAIAVASDLAVSLTTPVASVNPGDRVDYTLLLSNVGPSDQVSASVFDNFAPELLNVAWTCSPGAGASCVAGGSGNINETVDIPAGGQVSFAINAEVDSNFVGTISNSASSQVAAGSSDPVAANNADNVDISVISPADITAEKTVTGDFALGGTVIYSIVLSNNGSQTQFDNPGDEMVDQVPAELSVIDANADAGVIGINGNEVTWNGSIAAGAQVNISIVAVVNPNQNGGFIENQAQIFFDNDGDGINEANTLSTDPFSGGATVFGVAAAVPTLSLRGLVVMSLLFVGLAWWRQRLKPQR